MQPQNSQKHLMQLENNKVNNQHGTIITRNKAWQNYKLNDFLRRNISYYFAVFSTITITLITCLHYLSLFLSLRFIDRLP